MEQLSHAAFAVGVLGGVHDLLTRRIPNWLTLPACLGGLLAQGWLAGWPGLLDGVAGTAVGFALFFPIFLAGQMGAGDVKLQMAVGAWLGWRLALHVGIGAVLLGGAFALLEVLFRGRLPAVLRNGFSFLRSVLVPGLVPERLKVDENRRFAFGACIAAAVGAVIYLRHTGRIG